MINQPLDVSNNSIKVKLLTHLAQELLTPLTSVVGMTSVLNQEIYGPLTSKQKEYLDIIQNSSRQLRSLVEEIVTLAELEDNPSKLNRSAVDIESLCQQVVNTLLPVTSRQDQEISLSIGPGARLWLLDKDKVQQMLHHLVFSVIQSAGSGCIIRIHLSRKEQEINIAVWVFHPWLGDSLPHAKLYSDYFLNNERANYSPADLDSNESQITDQPFSLPTRGLNRLVLSLPELTAMVAADDADRTPHLAGYGARERLGLLLCCQLVEMQGGQLSIQGLPDSGYRYMLAIPCLNAMELLEG
ncbi:MAG TPA: histidine kinase dimerization/phospho-acceptor domain-containing protein [Kamptonema sp.]|nr:histidine kinase dimerization/phospho-acceptor domain-containing protein [Kamptonema sp.]